MKIRSNNAKIMNNFGEVRFKLDGHNLKFVSDALLSLQFLLNYYTIYKMMSEFLVYEEGTGS